MRRRHVAAAVLSISLLGSVAVSATSSASSATDRNRAAAALDRSNLRLAAVAVQAQALQAGALRQAVHTSSPAVRLLTATNALLKAARAQDPSGQPRSTVAVMGAPAYNLVHTVKHRPGHGSVSGTPTLRLFSHSLAIPSSAGWGMHRHHGQSVPARFQHADGKYVDPKLPQLSHPTVAAVAIRVALSRLGQPYVWAAAGPSTFDCSGLTMWSYAHAGIALRHFTGWQWNEGRLITAADALPGDLILIGKPMDHVGMYLGAGWMVNAPFTGHYVDVVPVPNDVDGLIRP